jgi:hypothetical protein
MYYVFSEPSIFDHERDLYSKNPPNTHCDALRRLLNVRQAKCLPWIFDLWKPSLASVHDVHHIVEFSANLGSN